MTLGSQPIVDLTADDLLAVHAAATGVDLDQARLRLRDAGGLGGAAGRPANHRDYADADLATQAAALAHGFAEAQAFIDGNKRTALPAMATFLDRNGWALAAVQPALAEWMLALSRGAGVDWLAEQLRPTLRPR